MVTIMQEVNWSAINKTLNDATRRSILELLVENKTLSYTEIMTILQIKNTGKLNYHLKSLGSLITKDEQGKYYLTERGNLAANMVKTFPTNVQIEKKNRTIKIATAMLLVVLGVAIISSAFVFVIATPVAGGVNTLTDSYSNRTIPQNTTIVLFSELPVEQNSSKFNIVWNASNPVSVYLLNSHNILLYTYCKTAPLLNKTSQDFHQAMLFNTPCKKEAFLCQFHKDSTAYL